MWMHTIYVPIHPASQNSETRPQLVYKLSRFVDLATYRSIEDQVFALI
jgi:hypothetical protein